MDRFSIWPVSMHRLMRRLCGRDDLADGADGHRFRKSADFELHRLQRKPAVGEHDVVADFNRPETGQLDTDGVWTCLKSRELEESDRVRDGAAHFLCLLICNGDVGTGNHLVLSVDDGS